MSRRLVQGTLLALSLILLGWSGRGRADPGKLLAQAPSPTPPVPNTGGGPPLQQFYDAGWNLVAITQTNTPIPAPALYTLASDGLEYALVQPTQTQVGVGYWADFPTNNLTQLIPRMFCDVCPTNFPPVRLPAGRWVMIGNPYTAPLPITVHGADVIEVYDPTTGGYQQTTQLTLGQGAFAYSAAGAMLTFGR